MMHAHDKTYIARLGFADPDKQQSRHDLACQYLSRPDVAKNIVSMVMADSRILQENLQVSCHIEIPLSKGEGQYKTTVGFIDVEIKWKDTKANDANKAVRMLYDYERKKLSELHLPYVEQAKKREEIDRKEDQADWRTVEGTIRIEVKILQLPISEIVRQINFYREYEVRGKIIWLCFTDFPVSLSGQDVIEHAMITHCYLGDQFNKWIKDGPSNDVADSPSF